MKKKAGIIAVVLIFAALITAGAFFVLPMFSEADSEADNSVYTVRVSELFGNGYNFTTNRYSGVVESQELVSVEADADKTIKQTYVKVGDDVKAGDKLFEYKIEDMQIQLEQDKLNVEQKQSEIKSINTQIESLEKEMNLSTTTANQKLSLTNQIEALKLDLKRANYEIETTDKEIEKLTKDIKHNVVTASIDGKIQSVGTDPDAYIKISSSGDFRIKASVGQENIFMISVDAPVIIRSRADETITWTGKVTSIDTSTAEATTNGLGSNINSKYPVYISIDNSDGLMIGQHLTVELDLGQNEPKEGLWIDSYYICDIDTKPYVWSVSDDLLTTKKYVELGDYDEMLMRYQILSGLSEDDYIAMPEDNIQENQNVVMFDGADDYYNELAEKQMQDADMAFDDAENEDVLLDENVQIMR